MKKIFKIKGKIVCEQKDFVLLLFFSFSLLDVTQLVCNLKTAILTFLFCLRRYLLQRVYIQQNTNHENCFTVLYPWLTPSCVIKTFLSSVACFFLPSRFTGIRLKAQMLMLINLKLVCQSRAPCVSTLEVRLGTLGSQSALKKKLERRF